MKLTKLFIALTTLCVATTSLYATTNIQKDKAVEIAKKYVPSGSKHITTNVDDDEYEIKFFNEGTQEIYEITLGARDGVLVEAESDSIAKMSSNAKNKYYPNKKYTPSKSQSVIKEAIQKQYKDLKITDIKLVEDDGYWVYEVKLASNKVVGEVKIDPETGKHLEREFVIINNSQEENKPVTLPDDVIVESAKVIGKDKASQIIYNMMPRGTTIGETTFNKTGSLYYETVYYYKDMRVEGKVDALTGTILEVSAKTTEFVDLHVENLYYKNPNYKPEIDDNEAKDIALKVVPNTKIENQKLGEHNLLWAQYVEVSNKDYKAVVIIDAETGKVKEVAYKNTNETSNQILSWSEIAKIIKEQVSNAQIKEYQVILENGQLVYKVKVDNEKYKHEFTLDAYTGKILSYTKEEIKPSKPSGILSKEEIKKIIMKEYGQHKITITEVKLDDDCTYEVEAYNKNFEYEFEVNAKTGKIIDVDKEKKDHDDKKDKDNKKDKHNKKDKDDKHNKHDDDEWDD